MIAIEIREPGEPEVLVPVERPVPEPAADEVLIRVAAAGVNRPDVFQRRGRYAPPPGASDIPGLEVAGVIEALGPGVTAWRVGDQVCALVTGGGYAEVLRGAGAAVPAGTSRDGSRHAPEPFPRRSSPSGPTCFSAGG